MSFAYSWCSKYGLPPIDVKIVEKGDNNENPEMKAE